jgi:hypothetical protein
MNFVQSRAISMFHDLTDGLHVGWEIEFCLHPATNRGQRATVVARSPTGRTIRDPHKISQMLPVEDWPEFARKALGQRVESDTDERLF